MINDLQDAYSQFRKFVSQNKIPNHERYIFPFFAGTYFTYRKVDVIRLISIAKSISCTPTYVDVGCGYGDFLEKIRQYLPNARGIEKNADIFYACKKPKPDFIEISDADWGINLAYDVIFVGWMEPGADFRDKVSAKTDVIITTIDQGLSLGAEFDGHGFKRIATWRTPSWDDINTELMNRYYTNIPNETRQDLSKLRTAHNLWYVYSKPSKSDVVSSALLQCIKQEDRISSNERYEFENVLDECGFRYHEKLDNPTSEIESKAQLWEVIFANSYEK